MARQNWFAMGYPIGYNIQKNIMDEDTRKGMQDLASAQQNGYVEGVLDTMNTGTTPTDYNALFEQQKQAAHNQLMSDPYASNSQKMAQASIANQQATQPQYSFNYTPTAQQVAANPSTLTTPAAKTSTQKAEDAASASWDTPYARQLLSLKYEYELAQRNNNFANMERIASQAEQIRQQAQAEGVQLPNELAGATNASFNDTIAAVQNNRAASNAREQAAYQADPQGYMQRYNQAEKSPETVMKENAQAAAPSNDYLSITEQANPATVPTQYEAVGEQKSFQQGVGTTAAPTPLPQQVQATTSQPLTGTTATAPQQAAPTQQAQTDSQTERGNLATGSEKSQKQKQDDKKMSTILSTPSATLAYPAATESTRQAAQAQSSTETPTNTSLGRPQSTTSAKTSAFGSLNPLDPNYKTNVYLYLRNKGYSTPVAEAIMQRSGIDEQVNRAQGDYWLNMFKGHLAGGDPASAAIDVGQLAKYNPQMAQAITAQIPSMKDMWNNTNIINRAQINRQWQLEDKANDRKNKREDAVFSANLGMQVTDAQYNYKKQQLMAAGVDEATATRMALGIKNNTVGNSKNGTRSTGTSDSGIKSAKDMVAYKKSLMEIIEKANEYDDNNPDKTWANPYSDQREDAWMELQMADEPNGFDNNDYYSVQRMATRIIDANGIFNRNKPPEVIARMIESLGGYGPQVAQEYLANLQAQQQQ